LINFSKIYILGVLHFLAQQHSDMKFINYIFVYNFDGSRLKKVGRNRPFGQLGTTFLVKPTNQIAAFGLKAVLSLK